jgi:hypothetical protein
MSNHAQQQRSNQPQAPQEPPAADAVTGWDENTFFVVVDEGDEDARLRKEVGRRCKGVNPGKVVSVLALMNISERHSVILVFRPHVPLERNMRAWPVKFTAPVHAKDFWSDTAGLNLKKFKLALGSAAAPATLRYKDEPTIGETGRLHYA